MEMALPVRNQRTEVARWDPFAEVQRLRSELGRFFEGWDKMSPLLGDGFIPQTDMEETDDAYIVELELPGVKKRDIDVSLAGRRLIVSGERKEKERVGVLRRRTRSMGRFRYEILLPDPVDEEGVTASLDEGVLTVRVPKAVSEQPRRIEVT
jgi:HSP20 family protein